MRTSEFVVNKASGKVNGTIAVYINEPVNGKPFKYDHHYILLLNLMVKMVERLDHQHCPR